MAGNGVPQDYSEAARLIRASADAGYKEAEYSYAVLLYNGAGVATNVSGEAFTWLRKAAESGHTEAQFEVGQKYLRGIQCQKDGNEALKWFKTAAAAGHAKAQHSAGLQMATGDGVRRRARTQAAQWFALWLRLQGLAAGENALGYCYDQAAVACNRIWRKRLSGISSP